MQNIDKIVYIIDNFIDICTIIKLLLCTQLHVNQLLIFYKYIFMKHNLIHLSKIIPFSFLLPLVGCKEEKRPNIIFILSDDHTSQSISAYGSIYKDVCPTPNIDKLANEGILFRNAFCTNSISGPSRASILTGQYSHINGFYKNEGGLPFDTTLNTFPKILHENGYTTALIGKWHLWSKPIGFDYYRYHTLNGEQGAYWNPVWNENGKLVQEEGYATTLTSKAALNWLENIRDKSKPFCLLYHFKAPHRPWEPDSCYQHIFDNVEMPYPETFYDNYQTREKTAGNTEMTIMSHLNRRDLKFEKPNNLNPQELEKWLNYGNKGEFLTPNDTLSGDDLKRWKYQRYIKDYLATTKSVDDEVGKLMSYLKSKGLDKNTIVIYCGDQGFYLGEHGWFDKRFMYEESLKMPFIVRFPKKIKNRRTEDRFITNVDFAPTLIDMCNIEIPEYMQGKSFKNLITGSSNETIRDAVYYHYYEYPHWHHVEPHYGVRTSRYKLIHFYYSMDVWEMYDLKNDPNELTNIYGQNEYTSIQQELHDILKRLQVETKDTGTLDDFRKITSINYQLLY